MPNSAELPNSAEQTVDHRDEVLLDSTALSAVQQVMAPPMMDQLIEVMDRTSRDTLKTLTDSLARDDLTTAQRAAHKLKGSAGNLGLRRLWRAATNLESSAELAAAQRLAAELPDLLEESLAAIRNAIKA